MIRNKWRRFLPKKPKLFKAVEVYTEDVFQSAKHTLSSMKIDNAKMASEAYKTLSGKRDELNPADKLVMLVLATPRAAQAQLEMDMHQGGYRNHKARLFELIEFNDTFVDTVLAFPEDQLNGFTTRLHALMNTFCDKINTLMFTDEQFDAITHGLSREIAVYKAVKKHEGLSVQMSSRVQDSRGMDMIIRDSSGKEMGIDCKTRSSFHFRLIELKRKGVITEEQRLSAELRGFAVLTKGKHDDFVQTTLLRIATHDLGEIHHYQFVDSSRFIELLRQALAAQPLYSQAIVG